MSSTTRITEAQLRRIIREELKRTGAHRVIAERSVSKINTILPKMGLPRLGDAPADIKAMLKKGVHKKIGMSEKDFREFIKDHEHADN